MKAMKTCRLPSPLGEMLLVANPDGTALAGLYLANQKYFPDAARWDDAPQLPLFRVAAVQLREYFAGARTTFDLPLEPAGTPFQRQVWAAIAVVPFAATITYGELAARCGRPSAVRAAGAATGRNPLTIVIPCHRVVNKDGRLGGYGGLLWRKEALLHLEGARRMEQLPLEDGIESNLG